MALPLVALPAVVAGFIGWLVRWFLATRLSQYAAIFAGMAFSVALMLAFIAAAYVALAAVAVAAPPQMAFALGFVPPSAPAMIGVYMSLVVGKRMMDWKAKVIDQAIQKAYKPWVGYDY